jgi:anti-sigma factor RsiW
MHEEWTDKLSDYLDGELPDQEQREVAAHLAGCADCAGTLDELRAVVVAAQSVRPALPPIDLWSGIAARIASAERTQPGITNRLGVGRRFSFSWPELAAAGVLLALLSGWATTRLITPPATHSAELQVRPPSGGVTVAALSLDDSEYDAAVSDLERALQNGRGRLDPATVKVVEENLTIIDQAVDEARRALEDDPANGYLSGHLVETRRRKLDLLRQAAALTEDLN